jgi:MoaA/NifB/PqqE/SkfB family radical SAM enzyme
MKDFNLEQYLSNGVENIVKGAIKASLKNPKESIFMAKYALASKRARKLRIQAEENGEHIPPFLIASITSQCNLHCKGCYARENHACFDGTASNQLTDKEWSNIFHQAIDLGIGFILLAGGEPLIRKDIIQAAGKMQDILFPIFTNGTMMDEEYIKIFEKNRNLVPVLSLEGSQEITDQRRGQGIYDTIIKTMSALNQNGILFGASITVTKENLYDISNPAFIQMLYEKGCKVVFFIEYVPMDETTKYLAPEEKERMELDDNLLGLRQSYEDMLFISFPGDEKTSGGCLAAGRGFFHINAHGGAEPCPFSPYSDTSLRKVTLKDALQSPLFQRLRDENVLMEEHAGGCVLFEKKELVEELLKQ